MRGHMIEEIKEKLKSHQIGDILDIATGKGDFIRFLKELGDSKTITAIDQNEAYGKMIGEAFPDIDVSYKVMDALNLEFDDCTFDTVSISNSLHHMPDVDRLLSEAYRVLKTNGFLIVREMFSDKGSQNEAQITQHMMHTYKADIDTKQGIIHNHPLLRSEIIEYIKKLKSKNVHIIENSRPQKDHPADEKMINNVIKMLDDIIEGIKTKAGYEELITQGDIVKERVKEYGIEAPATLFIIIEKTD